jgi:hypothetical protein
VNFIAFLINQTCSWRLKKHAFKVCFRHRTVVAVAGAGQAQSKPPLPQDKVLKLFEKTADKTSPQRLVAELDLASLKQLPQQTFTTHTPWFKEPVTFTGPLVRDVLATAQLKGKGQQIVAVALDDYKAKIPASDATNFDVILAHSINGKQMDAKNKGPLFIVYPYDSKKSYRLCCITSDPYGNSKH